MRLWGKPTVPPPTPTPPAAFAPGHCYEPFVKYGNLTSSDSTWAVGAVVEFACNPGYTLEQGSVTIECVDPDNPQWNETEPACRGAYGSRRSFMAAWVRMVRSQSGPRGLALQD